MTTTRIIRNAAALAVGASLLATLAGCTPPWIDQSACDKSNPTNIGFVISHRANAPAPQVLPQVKEVIDDAIRSNGDYVTVSSDGAPFVYDHNYLGSDAADGFLCSQDQDAALQSFPAQLTAAPAVTAEADVLAALGLAAAGVSGMPGNNILVVIDSGLQTITPLDLATGKALYGSTPDQIAESITLPAELNGMTVYWSGMGQTMLPQEPLNFEARDRLFAIWRAVLGKAGAKLVLITSPLSPIDSASSVPVSPVDVEPAPGLPQPLALNDDSVGFIPDTADYKDPAGAELVLAEIAERIKGDKTLGIVTITGISANYDTKEAQVTNSQARANTVRNTLIKNGVPADRLVAVGLGSDWPCYDPDNDDANRIVVLTSSTQQVGDLCAAG